MLLKMLRLYRDTIIIGQESCSMLKVLKNKTLQEELQNVMTPQPDALSLDDRSN